MKTLLLIAFISLPLTLHAKAAKETAKLRYSFEFILQKVLEKKNQTFSADIPLPELHYSSSTPLSYYQDIMFEQWGMRPDVITNAYSINHNLIFLMDDADYYETQKRCLDDSLAHELTHYVQDKYLHWDLNDESLEWDAIEVQTEFREKYCPVP